MEASHAEAASQSPQTCAAAPGCGTKECDGSLLVDTARYSEAQELPSSLWVSNFRKDGTFQLFSYMKHLPWQTPDVVRPQDASGFFATSIILLLLILLLSLA